MHHARIRFATALVVATALAACADVPTSPVSGSRNAGHLDMQSASNAGCGIDGRQLSESVSTGLMATGLPGVASLTGIPQRLQQVIVYGSPVQRPYRGYGATETYGGITQTFTYDRNMLDECSFPAGNTFTVIGPVEDDTLDVPVEAPDGIPQDLWNALPPAVKKQLREAAWYLADHFLPNDLPVYGTLARDARRAFFFEVLANGYRSALERTPDRRRETELFEAYTRGDPRGLSRNESLRADALLMGCMTTQRFRELRSFTGEQAENWATRVITAWAAEATRDYAMRFLEPQLSRLAAIGAQLGREGDSCGSSARYHFEHRPTELYDPSQNGDGDNSRHF